MMTEKIDAYLLRGAQSIADFIFDWIRVPYQHLAALWLIVYIYLTTVVNWAIFIHMPWYFIFPLFFKAVWNIMRSISFVVAIRHMEKQNGSALRSVVELAIIQQRIKKLSSVPKLVSGFIVVAISFEGYPKKILYYFLLENVAVLLFLYFVSCIPKPPKKHKIVTLAESISDMFKKAPTLQPA